MKLLARVIEFPERLETLITGAIMTLVMYAGVLLTNWLGIDLTEQLIAIGAAASAFVTFLIKVLLETYVPENLHGVVNAILSWLALVLGGSVAWKMIALVI